MESRDGDKASPRGTSPTRVRFCEAAPQWAGDDVEQCCQHCRGDFFLLGRHRHHCRGCGGLFCHACSDKRMALPHLGYPDPVRVCAGCASPKVHSTTRVPTRGGPCEITGRNFGTRAEEISIDVAGVEVERDRYGTSAACTRTPTQHGRTVHIREPYLSPSHDALSHTRAGHFSGVHSIPSSRWQRRLQLFLFPHSSLSHAPSLCPLGFTPLHSFVGPRFPHISPLCSIEVLIPNVKIRCTLAAGTGINKLLRVSVGPTATDAQVCPFHPLLATASCMCICIPSAWLHPVHTMCILVAYRFHVYTDCMIAYM